MNHHHDTAPDTPRDPVCGMAVKPDSPHRLEHAGHSWHFCSAHCATKFTADPARYDGSATAAPAEDRDPVCGMTVKPDSPHRVEHGGRAWAFCSARCVDKFTADPARYDGSAQDAGARHDEPEPAPGTCTSARWIRKCARTIPAP